MIHISQGHQKSIGLEVLLKSFLLQSQESLNNIKIHCFKETLENNLKFLNYNFRIFENFLEMNHKKINIKLLSNVAQTQTLTSLESAVNECNSDDILITLPSSKDQFQIGNQHLNGHTEFFRNTFKNKNITMAFIGALNNIFLLTDHIALKEVTEQINESIIIEKTSFVLDNIFQIRCIKRVFFSGINPHCGEDGLMGDDEKNLVKAIVELKNKYPDIHFFGPLSADTLLLRPYSKNDLFVYASHDQGLAPFKTLNGLVGINTTFGLPFLRLSPDHGTCFEFFGKNQANYQGMLFVLEEALTILKQKALLRARPLKL